MLASEFKNDFLAFAAAVGPRPSPHHTVERIDNEKGYERGNLRWATRKEQARNMRKNAILSDGVRSMPLAAWAEEFGFNPSTLWYRVFVKGMDIATAVTTPRYRRVHGHS